MRLYHYRSIECAVLEIGNGTFRFASRDELNDPIEGYLCVYWQGDKAAWEGLFRNYVCSLMQAIQLSLLAVDEKMLKTRFLMVDIHMFDNVPMGEILKNLGNSFLQEEIVQKLADFYGKNALRCSKKELQLILRSVHGKALKLCFKTLGEKHLIPDDMAEQFQMGVRVDDVDSFVGFLKEGPTDEAQRLAFIKAVEDVLEDYIELQFVQFGMDNEDFLYGERHDSGATVENKTDESIKVKRGTLDITSAATENPYPGRQYRDWMSVIIDFPRTYISELEDLVYPEGFVVCFSGKNDDSSMWGNYADNHKGVCLVYESDEDSDGKQSIPVAVDSGKTFRNLPVRRMNYSGQIIDRNFFETFGRLTYNQIVSWLTGTEGPSECLKSIVGDEASWRDKYWRVYDDKFLRKLGAWEHEDEYRMMISNISSSYNDLKKRILLYDSRILKGVIFGIRTSEYDKKKVVDALLKAGKPFEEVEFFQAEYDDLNQRVSIRKKCWFKS